MGVADLVPGVSGGTVAFFAGIYDQFLSALKSLKFSTMKGIHWSFLLPLGSGIFVALLLFSHLLSYVLSVHKVLFFAFLFGLIAAACLSNFRRIQTKRPLWLIIGFVLSFFISGFHGAVSVEPSLMWLFASGALAAMAMLLPGISGCYLLHLLGVYPVVIYALSTPHQSASLLILGVCSLGIATGVYLFSRVLASLIQNFKGQSLSLLLGMMVGSMRTLYPFHDRLSPLTISFTIIGFILLFLIDLRLKKAAI